MSQSYITGSPRRVPTFGVDTFFPRTRRRAAYDYIKNRTKTWGKIPYKKKATQTHTKTYVVIREILLIKDIGSLAPHQLPRNILIP